MTTRTSRLLTLLSLLQTGRDWPGSELATRLGVTDRTVRRDVDRLREMGYRIAATMGPEGGYRLKAGSALPPLLFDEEQTVAVAVALHGASAVGVGFEEAAVRALATIRQVMPSRLRQRLDTLEITTIPAGPGQGPPMEVSADVLISLAQAIRSREVLRFDYPPRALPGEAVPATAARRAEPHHIAVSHGRWYLLGWDLDRADWRLYGIDRMTLRTPNGPRFTPREVPGGDIHEFVSARFKGQDVNRWPCRGTVLLHLPAHDVLPFAGDGTVHAIADDRCTLEAGAWSWGALAAGYGRFETQMDVVDPPELKVAFARLARRYRAAAGDVPGASPYSGE